MQTRGGVLSDDVASHSLCYVFLLVRVFISDSAGNYVAVCLVLMYLMCLCLLGYNCRSAVSVSTLVSCHAGMIVLDTGSGRAFYSRLGLWPVGYSIQLYLLGVWSARHGIPSRPEARAAIVNFLSYAGLLWLGGSRHLDSFYYYW